MHKYQLKISYVETVANSFQGNKVIFIKICFGDVTILLFYSHLQTCNCISKQTIRNAFWAEFGWIHLLMQIAYSTPVFHVLCCIGLSSCCVDRVCNLELGQFHNIATAMRSRKQRFVLKKQTSTTEKRKNIIWGIANDLRAGGQCRKATLHRFFPGDTKWVLFCR